MPDKRLIVALDVEDVSTARHLVNTLDGLVDFWKVGSELLLANGCNRFIRELKERGHAVFLDNKLKDTPRTVEKTIANAAKLGVEMHTVWVPERHENPFACLAAAAEGRGDSSLKLLAVTALTSYRFIPYEAQVKKIENALRYGFNGTISNGNYTGPLKVRFGPDLLVVRPGIRLEDDPAHDQMTVLTPHEAISQGADHIVVGRTITQADNPRAATEAVLGDMAR